LGPPNSSPLDSLLQDTDPAKALYNTRDDFSCLSEDTLLELPNIKILTQDKPLSPACEGANSLSLQEVAFVTLKVHTGNQNLSHVFWVIQGLQQEILLGMDFLHQHAISYDPVTLALTPGVSPDGILGPFSSVEEIMLEHLSITPVQVCLIMQGVCQPRPTAQCESQVESPNNPYLLGGHFWIKPDPQGLDIIQISN
jgi:hypothetical protein